MNLVRHQLPRPREVRVRVCDRCRKVPCAERGHLDLDRSCNGRLAVAKRADVGVSARESGQLGSRRVEDLGQARRIFSADAIAMKLGIEKTAMIRLRAGISYALTEAMDEGHCGLPRIN
jgi:Helix-hairpin-helix containing domain